MFSISRGESVMWLIMFWNTTSSIKITVSGPVRAIVVCLCKSLKLWSIHHCCSKVQSPIHPAFFIPRLQRLYAARLLGPNHTMSAVFLWKYCFRITQVCWQSLQWLLQVGQRSARQTHDTDYKHGWQVFSQQSKESVRKVPGVDSLGVKWPLFGNCLPAPILVVVFHKLNIASCNIWWLGG